MRPSVPRRTRSFTETWRHGTSSCTITWKRSSWRILVWARPLTAASKLLHFHALAHLFTYFACMHACFHAWTHISKYFHFDMQAYPPCDCMHYHSPCDCAYTCLPCDCMRACLPCDCMRACLPCDCMRACLSYNCVRACLVCDCMRAGPHTTTVHPPCGLHACQRYN